MQLTNILLCLLTVATSVTAIPTPVEVSPRFAPTDIPQNIEGFPPKDWKCKTSQRNDKTQKFSASYIKDSVETGLRLRDNGNNKAGNSKYPEFLTNPETIPGLGDYEGETNIDHFPLNHDDKTVFTGGSPTSGARVVYQHTVESESAKFIGVWTHAGKKDGTLVKCEEV